MMNRAIGRDGAGRAAMVVGMLGIALAGGVWIVALTTSDPRPVSIALSVATPAAVLAGPVLGRRGRLSVNQILAVTGVGVAMFLITMVFVGGVVVMSMGSIGPDNEV